MPRNSSNAELETEELAGTAQIRAAIIEKHEPLLRSIAVLVAKTGRNRRWPEVMEIASEVLSEAVQEALKHAERFDPARSATAWVRGIAAKLLLSRRRSEARDWRCMPAAVARRRSLGGRDSHRSAPDRPTRRSPDGWTSSRRSLAFPRTNDGRSNSVTTKAWTVKSWQPPWEFPLPGAARVRVCRALQSLRAHLAPAAEEVLR